MTRFVALTVASALSMAAPAIAAPAFAAEAPAVRVAYADLDLQNAADVRALLTRIEAAARIYCVAPGYSMRMSVRRCTREMTKEMVSKIDLPALRVAYAESR